MQTSNTLNLEQGRPENTPEHSPENKSSKLKLILILVIPFITLMSATALYKSGYGTSKTVNNGELILPPISSKAFHLPTIEEDLWRLVVVQPKSCDSACEERIHIVRQLHVALGKEQRRVTKVFVSAQEKVNFLSKYPSYSEVNLFNQPEQFTNLLNQYPETIQQHKNETLVFIADPLGNVMMVYTPVHSGKMILKDMIKLLKLSNIG